jgi:hypothetical protein
LGTSAGKSIVGSTPNIEFPRLGGSFFWLAGGCDFHATHKRKSNIESMCVPGAKRRLLNLKRAWALPCLTIISAIRATGERHFHVAMGFYRGTRAHLPEMAGACRSPVR